MYLLATCLLIPAINALVSVEIHRYSFYHPQSPCAFLRNASLSSDASIQTCIWGCVNENDCQTAVYFNNEKICSMFAEICRAGSIQSSGNVWASVICYRKNHDPIIACESSAAPNQEVETTTTTTVNAFTPSTVTCSSTVATPCTTTTTLVASCHSYEVSWNNHCYYLDGSSGNRTIGYSRATNAVLTCIASYFASKTYRSTISDNCCVWTPDKYECYGMSSNCNSAGPFTSGPKLNGAGCTNVQIHQSLQLTFCGSN